MKNKKLIIYIMLIVLLCFSMPVSWAGTLQEDTACSFSIQNNGSNSFTVTRSGDTTLTRSVLFRTISGTAIEGVHFDEQHGILTFAPGETSKTIEVTEHTGKQIIYDAYPETVYTAEARWYMVELYGSEFVQGGSVTAKRTIPMDGEELNVTTLDFMNTLTLGENIFHKGYLNWDSFTNSVAIHDYKKDSIKWGYYIKNGKEGEQTSPIGFDLTDYSKDDFDPGKPQMQNFIDYWIALKQNISLGWGLTVKKNISGYYYFYYTYDSNLRGTTDNWGSGKLPSSLPEKALGIYCLDSDDTSHLEQNSSGNYVLGKTDFSRPEGETNLSKSKSIEKDSLILTSDHIYLYMGADGDADDEFEAGNIYIGVLYMDTTAPKLLGVKPGNSKTTFYAGEKYYTSVISSEIVNATLAAADTIASTGGNLTLTNPNTHANVLTYEGTLSGAVNGITIRGEDGMYTDHSYHDNRNVNASPAKSYTMPITGIARKNVTELSVSQTDTGVEVRDGETLLIENKDYNVNIISQSGSLRYALIEGLGAYKGSRNFDMNTGTKPYTFACTGSSGTSATVSLTNETATGSSLMYILAAYDANGLMVACNSSAALIESSESASLTVTYPASSNVQRIKAFALDGTAMIPLVDAWSETISN